MFRELFIRRCVSAGRRVTTNRGKVANVLWHDAVKSDSRFGR